MWKHRIVLKINIGSSTWQNNMSVLVDKGKEPLCCSSFSAVAEASVNDFFFKLFFLKKEECGSVLEIPLCLWLLLLW